MGLDYKLTKINGSNRPVMERIISNAAEFSCSFRINTSVILGGPDP